MSATDPIEAVERARESLIRVDAEMLPGRERRGPALAHVVNAIEELADAIEAIAKAGEITAMTLASIKPGDIIRAAESHGVVVEKERGRLKVQWLGSHSLRWVKAGEVEAWWGRRR